MKERVKVFAEDLARGMFVCELDRPWLESPFLFQGFRIETDDELAQLRETCQYVFVDVEQSSDEVVPRLLQRAGPSPPPRAPRRSGSPGDRNEGLDRAQFHAELKRARGRYDETRAFIVRALEDSRLGRTVDSREACRLVGELAESIVRNANALVWLTHLKSRDEYTVTHCINVCILALAFGRFLGLERGALETVGLGALLHDLGKMRIPPEVLHKPGRLTAEEFDLIKTHPVWGHQILAGAPGLTGEILDIVRHHHERLDGRGYPDGLAAEQVGLYTRIVSIVDIYDAVTSDRAYRDGIPPHEALKNIYDWAPEGLDEELVAAFIRCLGIYPIGSLVELASGHVGVVVQSNPKHRLRPVVLLVLNRRKEPYARRKLLNLASPRWEGEAERPEIGRILGRGAYGLDVRRIIEAECRLA